MALPPELGNQPFLIGNYMRNKKIKRKNPLIMSRNSARLDMGKSSDIDRVALILEPVIVFEKGRNTHH